jgi:hypothetical protein
LKDLSTEIKRNLEWKLPDIPTVFSTSPANLVEVRQIINELGNRLEKSSLENDYYLKQVLYSGESRHVPSTLGVLRLAKARLI